MKLPEFMFMSNKTELPSVELIQHTRPPFHTAQVFFFKNEGEEMQFTTGYKQGYFNVIAGYRIYIVWQGTITGKLPATADTAEHIYNTLNQMTRFYERTRIYENPGRFARYSITA